MTQPTTPPAKALAGTATTTGQRVAAAWSVTLTSSATDNRMIHLEAAANQSLQGTGHTLAIYDKTTGTRLAACGDAMVICNGNAGSGYYW